MNESDSMSRPKLSYSSARGPGEAAGSDIGASSALSEVMCREECHLHANKHAIHAAWVGHAAT